MASDLEYIPSMPSGPEASATKGKGFKGVLRQAIVWPKGQYNNLSSSKNEIRLLRLQSGAPKTPLRCGHLTVSLDKPPKYAALSYNWGDRSNPGKILLNDLELKVTANLEAALLKLRSTTEDRILWIDALCIDQNNVSERNGQVQKMGLIYKMAYKVIVWLGPASNDSALAISFVRELNEKHQKADWLRGVVVDANYRSRFAALNRLFGRDYWDRTWVVQETSSAREIVVYCGDGSIKWSDLDSIPKILKPFWELMRQTFDNADFLKIRTSGPQNMQVTRSIDGRVVHPTAYQMLRWHRKKDATDPRDKVIGLVGLSPQLRDQGLVDYSCSVRNLYTEVVKVVIQQTGKLDIICSAAASPNPHGLPSWAPDWSQSIDIYSLNDIREFSATRDIKPVVGLKDEVLLARGVCIAVIEDVGVPCKEGIQLTNMKPFSNAVDDWHERLTSFFENSPETVLAFARTLFFHPMFKKALEDIKSTAALLHEIQLLSESFQEEDLEVRNEMLASIGDEEILRDVSTHLNQRRLFIASGHEIGLHRGHGRHGEYACFGLARESARVGDLVCILLGCSIPVILRVADDGDSVKLVGEAFVDGFMTGEIVDAIKCGAVKVNDFEIV